jgi:hypothetical protein
MKWMKNLHEFQQQYHNIVLVNLFIFIYIYYISVDIDIPDHMIDDLNQIANPNSVPIITPPFSHLTHQNQHSSSTTKKDDDHLFLHPSCMGDNHRRIQDPYPISSNNSNNIQQQQTLSVCIIYHLIINKTK